MKATRVAVAAVLVGCAHFATADSVVVGGSGLLTAAYANQLAGYLGEGDLVLTNIFSHTAGDGKSAVDFHAATDGKGRTFSVLHLTNLHGSATDQIVGGYDPQSWNSSQLYNELSASDPRNAFLFNLASNPVNSFVLQEKPSVLDSDTGRFQTYNYPSFGPTFGGGHDLYVDVGLNSGYAYQAAYGQAGFNGTNVFGSTYTGLGAADAVYASLDVFTIADAPAAPLPGVVMGGVVLLGAFGASRVRRVCRTTD